MTAPVPFEFIPIIESSAVTQPPRLHQFPLSSSQLLDLLQALRLGHFFFPFTYFKATHKKTYLTAQAFQTPTIYFLHLAASTPPKTLKLVTT